MIQLPSQILFVEPFAPEVCKFPDAEGGDENTFDIRLFGCG
jgi:hypothetical protein